MLQAAAAAFVANRTAGLIGAALLFATGFAAAEVYEHVAPWGLGPKRDALHAQIYDIPKGWKFRLEAMTNHRDNREEARVKCERERKKENVAATRNVEAGGDERAAARGAGFEEGYAAGKVAGLLNCKGEDDDATTDDDDGRGEPAARGVPARPEAWADGWNERRYDPGPAVRPERPGG